MLMLISVHCIIAWELGNNIGDDDDGHDNDLLIIVIYPKWIGSLVHVGPTIQQSIPFIRIISDCWHRSSHVQIPSLILWYVTAIYIEVSYCSLLEREESTVSSILQIGYDRVSFLFFNQLKSSTQLFLSLLLLYGTQSIINRILVVHFINISSAIRKVAAWDLASANCWCWKIANCNLASVCVWQKHRWRWQPLPEVRQSPFF